MLEDEQEKAPYNISVSLEPPSLTSLGVPESSVSIGLDNFWFNTLDNSDPFDSKR